MASNTGNTVVEQSTHNSKFEGSGKDNDEIKLGNSTLLEMLAERLNTLLMILRSRFGILSLPQGR